jgi:hypothetical protein
MSDKPGDTPDAPPKVNVTDRRRFEADGTPREDAAQDAGAPEDAGQSAPEDQPGFRWLGEAPPPPPIDFSAFILSLGQAALINLGVAPVPDSGKIIKDLEAARETIDILGLLREKTRGNLTDEESRLLDGLLYQLRMSFVEAKKA